MASPAEIQTILQEALGVEVKAQENCEQILKIAEVNGFKDVIDHIRIDEVHHQELVKKLMAMIG